MTIEEELKEIRPYNSCRVCLHFIRVNFESVTNIYHRQGFCILGQLEGNYGYYLSCSGSTTCMGFIISELNKQITLAEQNLKEDVETFCESVKDKRTNNYKLVEPLLKQHEEFFTRTNQAPLGLASLFADRKIHQIAREWYESTHRDEFMRVYNMVSLRKADHSKFLAKVSVLLHDEICKCDKIEFKASGSQNNKEA